MTKQRTFTSVTLTHHSLSKDALAPDDAAALHAYLGKLNESEKNDLVGVMKSYITQQVRNQPQH